MTLRSRLAATLFLAFAFPAWAQTLVPVEVTQPTLPLRIVGEKDFCERLRHQFALFGQQNGYDQVQSALLASAATSGLMQEFVTGRATDYVSAVALARFASVPPKVQGYLPVSHFMARAMGINKDVTLALSVGELRFIPFAQRGMELVVIAHNTAAMTTARAQKVAEVARKGNIKINVVWLGEPGRKEIQIEEARTLAWLAAVTGGSFANLSGNGAPCTQAL